MELAAIVAVEAREACKGEPDLTERIKKAMRAARQNWMAPPEAEQFRGAIAAAMSESEGEERELIRRSAEALGKLGAMLQALQAGVPVNFEAMEPPAADTIPLRKLWDETGN